MLSHWPIRTKLKLGLGILLVSVLALFANAMYGLYAYRELVRSLSARSSELPLANEVQKAVSDLRVTLNQAKERLVFPDALGAEPLTPVGEEGDDRHAADQHRDPSHDDPFEARLLSGQFQSQLDQLVDAIGRYRRQLDENHVEVVSRLSDDSPERATLAQINAVVGDLLRKPLDTVLVQDWLPDKVQVNRLLSEVEQLQSLGAELPRHLHERLQSLAGEVKARYRGAIILAWINVAAAVVLLAATNRVFYKWFAEPLHQLVLGSRKVAAGDFEHRIRLDARDEIGELADALNAMTARFREIRDDLDHQVRERTSQVVRSEQLASVGFLAAGVSHEINNPLASIALCSESLEGRLQELLDDAGPQHAENVQVARNYLQMIQREAFRCKQITEKLLDFARRGDSQRNAADLRELVAGVIDMVQHLGQYQDRRLELAPGPPIIAAVNAQEIKQVVLNLATNGLESLDPGGVVRIAVDRQGDAARIIVEDNGCGMTDDVHRHLFEPFFTRRRTGQGTGLGLSISHRIVEEHRGRIEAHSDGPGRGSRFVVSLPAHSRHAPPHPVQAALAQPATKEHNNRYKAA